MTSVIYRSTGCASILGATLWRGDTGRFLAFMLSLFGFSLYLTYLEFWVIEAICQWCIASATAMTLLFAVCTPPGYPGTSGSTLKSRKAPRGQGPRRLRPCDGTSPAVWSRRQRIQ